MICCFCSTENLPLWVQGQSYTQGALINYKGTAYVALTSHTSITFPDLATDQWVSCFDIVPFWRVVPHTLYSGALRQQFQMIYDAATNDLYMVMQDYVSSPLILLSDTNYHRQVSIDCLSTWVNLPATTYDPALTYGPNDVAIYNNTYYVYTQHQPSQVAPYSTGNTSLWNTGRIWVALSAAPEYIICPDTIITDPPVIPEEPEDPSRPPSPTFPSIGECCICDPSGLETHGDSVNYVVGDKVVSSVDNEVYYALTNSVSATSQPINNPNDWINCNDIVPSYPPLEWVANNGQILQQFQIVYEATSNRAYLVLQAHTNTARAITDRDYYELWDYACVCNYGSDQVFTWTEGYNFSVGQTVLYNGYYWVVIKPVSGVIPGSDGSTWADNGSYIRCGQPQEASCNFREHNEYVPTKYYRSNDTVYYDGGYYTSLLDNNIGNTPSFPSDFWLLCVQVEPNCIGGIYPNYNASLIYDLYDYVTKDGVRYQSLRYENTETPSLLALYWYPCDNNKEDCPSLSLGEWQQGTAYQAGQVVNKGSDLFYSIINGNLDNPSTSNNWVRCSPISTTCSSESVGLWNINTFYPQNTVVEFLGSYFVSLVNSLANPPLDDAQVWQPCEINAPTDCADNSLGDWVSGTLYALDNVVLHNGIYWQSLIAENSTEPNEFSEFWSACSIEELNGIDPDPIEEQEQYDTIVYSEKYNDIAGFYDFQSRIYFPWFQFPYSNQPNSVKLKKHFGGLRAHYYSDTAKDFIVRFVVNDVPNMRAVYSSIRGHIDSEGEKLTSVKFRTNIVDYQEVLGNDNRYVIREGEHVLPLKDKVSRERMRGDYLEVTYLYNGGSEPVRVRIIAATTRLRLSPRDQR